MFAQLMSIEKGILMHGKAAKLRPGDRLIFGDSNRSIRVIDVDSRRKIVRLFVEAPEHVRIVRCSEPKTTNPDGETVIVPKT